MIGLYVAGDFERGRAAREEERKAHHMKKGDTEVQLKRLREVNAELLEALKLWHKAHMILAQTGTAPLSDIPRLQFEAQAKRKEAAIKGNIAIARAES